jgi:hypothetical protein
MGKNYILLILFLLLSNHSFSQTNTTDELAPAAATASESIPKETAVLSKNQIPTDQKITQEVFYIVNDKPVDRLKYQQHLQQAAGKK